MEKPFQCMLIFAALALVANSIYAQPYQTQFTEFGDVFTKPSAPVLLKAKLQMAVTHTPIEGENIYFQIYLNENYGWQTILDDGITTTSLVTDDKGIGSVYYLPKDLAFQVPHPIRVMYNGRSGYNSTLASAYLTVNRADAEFTKIHYHDPSISSPIPLVLVHGNGSDSKPPYYRWDTFKAYIDNHNDGFKEFDVYIWKHDTELPIGFNGTTGNARQLADFINDYLLPQYPPGTKVLFVAHSRGGLVCRSFMNYNHQGDKVLGLITLGTPHHGSPFAVPDWSAMLWANKIGMSQASFDLYNSVVNTGGSLLTQFDYDRMGSLNLAWDNQDGAIKDYQGADLTLVSFAYNGRIGLTTRDLNETNSYDGDETILYSDACKDNYGTLAELNQQEAYLDKIVPFAAYDDELSDNNNTLELGHVLKTQGHEHAGLSWITKLLAYAGENISTNNSTYFANDGLVPLQSALFLNITGDTPFSELKGSQISLLQSISSFKQVKRQYIFSGKYNVKDHLDLLDTSNQTYWSTLVNEIRDFIDNTPPTVQITSPQNGNTVSGIVNINANATDAGSGINRVEFYINGSYLYTDYQQPYTAEWKTAQYPSGSYTIKAKAYDNAGNSAEHSISVTISSEALYAGSVTPSSGTTDNSFEFSVYYKSTSNQPPDLNSIKLYVDDKSYTMQANTSNWSEGVRFFYISPPSQFSASQHYYRFGGMSGGHSLIPVPATGFYTFVAAKPSAGTITLTVSSNSTQLDQPITVSAKIYPPKSSYPINFYQDPDKGTFLSDNPVYTDANGVATVTYHPTQTGSLNIFAFDANNNANRDVKPLTIHAVTLNLQILVSHLRLGIENNNVKYRISVRVEQNGQPYDEYFDIKFATDSGTWSNNQSIHIVNSEGSFQQDNYLYCPSDGNANISITIEKNFVNYPLPIQYNIPPLSAMRAIKATGIGSVSFSPVDDKIVFNADPYQSHLKLYDISQDIITSDTTYKIPGSRNEMTIYLVRYSPDGTKLFIGGGEGSRIIEVKTGKSLAESAVIQFASDGDGDACWVDNNYLLVGDAQKYNAVINASNLSESQSLLDNSHYHASVDAAGNYAIMAFEVPPKTILFNKSNWSQAYTFDPPGNGRHYATAISPDGSKSAVYDDYSGTNRSIYIFNNSTGQTLKTLAENARIYHLDWNPARPEYLVSVQYTKTTLWNVDSGTQEAAEFSPGFDNGEVSWSGNGEKFAVAGGNEVKLFAPFDMSEPLIALTSPMDGFQTDQSVVELKGFINDDRGVSSARYRINAGTWIDLPLGTDNRFSLDINLQISQNTIEVQAFDINGKTSTKTIRGSRQAVVAPTKPEQALPANGSLNQMKTLSLRWHPVIGAASYRLQISTDSLFTILVLDDSTITDTSRHVSSLLNSKKYYWRVNAKNTGGTSAYSDIWHLTTIVAAPLKPLLVFPSNRATNQPTNLAFQWRKAARAAKYRMQIAIDSLFTTSVIDDSTLTDTTRVVTGLQSATTYYWHVRASNIGGMSQYSTRWSFRTAVELPNVTFQVNMKIKMREGAFQPNQGDYVTARGSFNNWGADPPGNLEILNDTDGDSIYTKVLPLAPEAIEYKFWKTLRGGLGWETNSNRQYSVVAGNQTTPLVYFSNDSVYTPPIAANVTFRVNMKIKMRQGAFRPDLGDVVRVAGTFNGWGSSSDVLTDSDKDSIYSKTIFITGDPAIQYKFVKTPRAGLEWENDPNREYTIPTGGVMLPVVYFDNDPGAILTVSKPPVGVTWKAGTTDTVKWSSNGVTGNVNIKLSTDGGSTFPITLFANTPNDGIQPVTVPNKPSTMGRIKVESIGMTGVFGISPGDFNIYGSNNALAWLARHNAPTNGHDEAQAIAVDDAGNVYVTGNSHSVSNGFDYLTVKYNQSGVKQWTARYNGSGNSVDVPYAIAIDGAGNVYVAGYSTGAGSKYDMVTIKYNNSGKWQWVVRYNGPGNDDDEIHGLALDNSGNVYVTGYSTSINNAADFTTIKYNSMGVQQWIARYDGTGKARDVARVIKLDNAGNVFVSGFSAGPSGTGLSAFDYATVKYNNAGVEQWSARYNGKANDRDQYPFGKGHLFFG